MEQNQEEIKEVLFPFNKSILSNETLSRKLFFEMKDTRRRWLKKIWKSWRNGFFLNTRCLLENEIWTNILLLEKQFLWWIFCEVQKIQNFCGRKGMKQVVFVPKEKGSIYLVRKNTLEKIDKKKVRDNKGDRTKTFLQKKDQMKKVFSKKKKTKN